ncbi:MAG: glycosyltransferase [Thermoplasmata archaeon]
MTTTDPALSSEGQSVAPPSLRPIDVLVRTFNSARTLAPCLAAAQRYLPIRRIIVVDRYSTDRTAEIAREFGADLHFEEVGIGRATSLAAELARTENVLYLDGDVVIRSPKFYGEAIRKLARPGVGAVVGTAVGHKFLYGLPLGLTLLPRTRVASAGISDQAQGEETYYLRQALKRDRLRIAYVPDAMEHSGSYRGRDWPEWQGAQMRLAAGWSTREITYSFLVILLIHSNSRSARNVLYTPIFFLKLMRGFLDPQRWRIRDRRTLPALPTPG